MQAQLVTLQRNTRARSVADVLAAASLPDALRQRLQAVPAAQFAGAYQFVVAQHRRQVPPPTDVDAVDHA